MDSWIDEYFYNFKSQNLLSTSVVNPIESSAKPDDFTQGTLEVCEIQDPIAPIVCITSLEGGGDSLPILSDIEKYKYICF
jgi:hypothetical protein